MLEGSDVLKSENVRFLISDLCHTAVSSLTTQHQMKEKLTNDVEVGMVSFKVLSCNRKPRPQ
jgi:hypothetical protein